MEGESMTDDEIMEEIESEVAEWSLGMKETDATIDKIASILKERE
jgi:hypothetical protein